ncbi:nitrogenase molybdenum-iron cofactor biosynthesis protein NifE [Rhizobium leguminosarum bv. trifolii WSM597]|uniref:Nitrogenase molybdenum-iron cofactor biosynthesis protein NifE n=1 Tax=Rhizobium leguminosarum bv. trifolii WSM597 TaxID=754764 RepID=J0H9Z4_RHILT|nr:nitrogenase iron-molybdenum cofactor biosynthesis protein NifE [Rhizobium leguminosarum]EJB07193.1 nitrogenase molybdenum-iron cofactor biosynthesis protein NifE [Rhizobium leguminosarum bv. trifolii WSM597]
MSSIEAQTGDTSGQRSAAIYPTKENKACQKATKGSASGGCAFDGAKVVLQPIVDVAHLIHAPPACEGNSWDNRGAASSGPVLWRTSFTTDLTELDIVTGDTDQKLLEAIREIKKGYAPAAIFVYGTCVSELVAGNIDAVCRHAAQKFEIPVVPVRSPGFRGSKSVGNRIAGEALLEHVIGTVEADNTSPYDINILGEFNLSGEFWLVKPLLDRLGIRVRACIPGDARFAQVGSAHRSRAAMVVCSTAQINLARKMDARWDIPFFEGSFYGISGTSESLRRIALLLVNKGAGLAFLHRTEELIADEEERVWKNLEVYRRRLVGKRVHLNTGGVKSWSIVHALIEIGMEIIGTSVKKSTFRDKDKIKQMLKNESHLHRSMAASELYAMLRGQKPDIMLSGGRTQFVALEAKIPWLDVNQERQHPYAGYEGMVKLAQEIDLAIHSPIWAQLREPEPW